MRENFNKKVSSPSMTTGFPKKMVSSISIINSIRSFSLCLSIQYYKIIVSDFRLDRVSIERVFEI
jgi:hypothetical protein